MWIRIADCGLRVWLFVLKISFCWRVELNGIRDQEDQE